MDVHALRHSFGTLLSTSGVSPRTAQAAMRHSTIDLTMNTYTDPRLLDVHGALDSLPALPIHGNTDGIHKATGTTDAPPAQPIRKFAPVFAPKADKSSKSRSSGDKSKSCDRRKNHGSSNAVSLDGAKKNAAIEGDFNHDEQMETKGLEPSTPGLQSRIPYHAEKPSNPRNINEFGRFYRFPERLQTIANKSKK